MGQIRKRGGVYWIRYYRGGRRFEESAKTSKFRHRLLTFPPPAAPPPTQEDLDREAIRDFAVQHPSAHKLLIADMLTVLARVLPGVLAAEGLMLLKLAPPSTAGGAKSKGGA